MKLAYARAVQGRISTPKSIEQKRDLSLRKLIFAVEIMLAFLLTACGSAAGSPDAAVERYLEAIVSTDQIGAVNAACAGDELTAVLESSAYEGVDSQLEDSKCEGV